MEMSANTTETPARHDLTVGTILVSGWGYDQTNVDFYQVVKVSACFVWVREIASNREQVGGPQSDSYHATPTPYAYLDKAKRKRPYWSGDEWRIGFGNYSMAPTAGRWDGTAQAGSNGH